jgi:hypothetical protein
MLCVRVVFFPESLSSCFLRASGWPVDSPSIGSGGLLSRTCSAVPCKSCGPSSLPGSAVMPAIVSGSAAAPVLGGTGTSRLQLYLRAALPGILKPGCCQPHTHSFSAHVSRRYIGRSRGGMRQAEGMSHPCRPVRMLPGDLNGSPLPQLHRPNAVVPAFDHTTGAGLVRERLG